MSLEYMCGIKVVPQRTCHLAKRASARTLAPTGSWRCQVEDEASFVNKVY